MKHIYRLSSNWRTFLTLFLTGNVLAPVLAQERAIGPRESKREPRHWALVIGVNDYVAQPRLKYCVKDASTLADALRASCGYSTDRVYLMVDGLKDFKDIPTRENLLKTMRIISELAGEGDTVLFYFSGHGVSVEDKGYLVPIDARKAAAEELISIAELRDILRKSKAARRVMILDACHSGSEKDATDAAMPQHFEDSLKADAEGVVTLASCRASETSLEAPWHDQGLFTYWLVRGLTGAADQEEAGNKDGKVEIKELYDFVYERVRSDAAKQQRHPQNPFLLASISGRIELAEIKPTSGNTEAPVQPVVKDSLRHEIMNPNGAAMVFRSKPARMSQALSDTNLQLGILMNGTPIEVLETRPDSDFKHFKWLRITILAGEFKDKEAWITSSNVRISK